MTCRSPRSHPMSCIAISCLYPIMKWSRALEEPYASSGPRCDVTKLTTGISYLLITEYDTFV